MKNWRTVFKGIFSRFILRPLTLSSPTCLETNKNFNEFLNTQRIRQLLFRVWKCGFVLLGSLSRRQGGGYRAAWLGHIKELLLISGWCYQTLVFVSPHNQVQKVIQELLRNVVSGSMLTPGKQKQIIRYKRTSSNSKCWIAGSWLENIVFDVRIITWDYMHGFCEVMQ